MLMIVCAIGSQSGATTRRRSRKARLAMSGADGWMMPRITKLRSGLSLARRILSAKPQLRARLGQHRAIRQQPNGAGDSQDESQRAAEAHMIDPYETDYGDAEKCEWNPVTNRAATDIPGDGCWKVATVCVGRGKHNWHLCAECAALPAFRRFSKRPLRAIA